MRNKKMDPRAKHEDDNAYCYEALLESLTRTNFELGVLLLSAVLSMGMRTFASGKYAPIEPLGML